jgi:outer membrane protein OmpA-like peptidoglycan-associated protein
MPAGREAQVVDQRPAARRYDRARDPARLPIMRIPLFIVLMLLGWLAACGTAPAPTPRPASPPATAASSAATKAALAAEQRRLADLFRGTPVVFALQPEGSMRVEVPLRYCFDQGRVAVKPPLAAVLDRVARGQRNQTTRLTVTAPTDPGATGLQLATDRAVSTRDHLVERGVAATRISISTVARGGAVKIVVADAALP